MIFTLDVIKLHVLQNIESLAMHTQLKTCSFLPDSLAYSTSSSTTWGSLTQAHKNSLHHD